MNDTAWEWQGIAGIRGILGNSEFQILNVTLFGCSRNSLRIPWEFHTVALRWSLVNFWARYRMSQFFSVPHAELMNPIEFRFQNVTILHCANFWRSKTVQDRPRMSQFSNVVPSPFFGSLFIRFQNVTFSHCGNPADLRSFKSVQNVTICRPSKNSEIQSHDSHPRCHIFSWFL